MGFFVPSERVGRAFRNSEHIYLVCVSGVFKHHQYLFDSLQNWYINLLGVFINDFIFASICQIFIIWWPKRKCLKLLVSKCYRENLSFSAAGSLGLIKNNIITQGYSGWIQLIAQCSEIIWILRLIGLISSLRWPKLNISGMDDMMIFSGKLISQFIVNLVHSNYSVSFQNWLQ